MSNIPGHSPYSSPFQNPQPQQRPPAPKSSAGKIILIIVAVIGVVTLLGCCACGGLVYFGMGIETDAIAESIKDDPNVMREIGEIESLSYNFNATGDHPDWDVYVYDVKGDKGSGTLYVTEPDLIASEMELETANGTFNVTFDENALAY